MAADGGQRYELGRLILDYVRTFMWPLIVIALATFYFEDLMEVVKGREVNIFGLEIGPAVARLQETTEQELADLQALVAELKANYRRELEAAGRSGAGAPTEAIVSEQTREAAQAVETKLSSLRANLGREAQALREAAIQQALPQQAQLPQSPVQMQPAPALPTGRAEEATRFERAGFEAILERRFDDALRAFESAREVWPEYHNVAEIADYLARMGATQAPLDAADWATLERTLLTSYSWGMPADLRNTFRTRVTASN
jgi:hypothetical protein